MPLRLPNDAAVPIPSTLPDVLLIPAIVITIPSGRNLRIQRPLKSVKYAFGAGTPPTLLLSSTIPWGCLILADDP